MPLQRKDTGLVCSIRNVYTSRYQDLGAFERTVKWYTTACGSTFGRVETWLVEGPITCLECLAEGGTDQI